MFSQLSRSTFKRCGSNTSLLVRSAAGFHSAGSVSKAQAAATGSVVEADSSASLNKLYHHSGLALAILTPAAFALSPSVINMPIDIILGIVFPLHSHVGLNYIVSDYVPKAQRSLARYALLAATVVTCLGLLKLNIQGPGLTESIKSLWRKPSNNNEVKDK